MAGMEVLGRNANIIPVASGVPFKMRSASSAMVVVTGASAVVTLQEQPGFGGSPIALSAIKNIYWSTSSTGTAAWQKITYSATNLTGIYLTNGGPLSGFTMGTTIGLTTAAMACFHIFTTEMADPENYLVVTATTGSPTVVVVLSDLVVQRAPANLEILSA
jgi:hypothetical protein